VSEGRQRQRDSGALKREGARSGNPLFGERPTQVSEGSFTDTHRTAFTSQDFRFTTKGNALYAVCLDWPGTEATIKSLGAGSKGSADRISSITMLGSDECLTWSQDVRGLRVKTPAKKPCDHAYAFKIAL
jgi:alpha-L-fucosidase